MRYLTTKEIENIEKTEADAYRKALLKKME